jgi:hypothetical protein
MDSNPSTTTNQYKQVVVDVPEDRIAEFHAFFARFLSGPSGRGRRGRHGRPHHGAGRHRCGERRQAVEHDQATGQQAATTEV